MIGIRLLETDDQIQGKINKTIREEINTLLRKSTNDLTKQIRRAVERWVLEQPEIPSLQAAGTKVSLNAQFGLSFGQGELAVTQILSAINSSIEVEFRPIDKKFRGGITFNVQPTNFRTILDIPAGFTLREGGPLHWMSWLLTEGTRTIVYGYTYKPSFAGVSGGGTMVEGGVWRVPPQFAGTLDDNFITRALSNRDKEIASIFRDVLR